MRLPQPGPVFHAYWRFAHERHRVYLQRAQGQPPPWTDDPILANHRFTNAYRVLDRVTQTLLREAVAPGGDGAEDVFLRVMLFKIFNRPETWRHVVDATGLPTARNFDPRAVAAVLDERRAAAGRVYSNAYIVPPVPGEAGPKHHGHLALIARMLDDGLPRAVVRDGTLEGAYRLLLRYPGLGPFLAFQFAVDLNYTPLTQTGEDGFVVAGPGARDGLRKCFPAATAPPEELIMLVAQAQEDWFDALSLPFAHLHGRALQPVDVQNLFCEISKYARVAFPDVRGLSGRVRIKQAYRPAPRPLPALTLPAKWGIEPRAVDHPRHGAYVDASLHGALVAAARLPAALPA